MEPHPKINQQKLPKYIRTHPGSQGIFHSRHLTYHTKTEEATQPMRVTSIKKIDPKPSRCIEVTGEDRLFAAGGQNGHSIVSHNSVTQRIIINSVIMRPDRWRLLGIDLKKVELSRYRKYSNVVLGVATEMEDAVTILKFAHQTMMKRYSEMEQLGINNFVNLPEPGFSLMILADEIGELFGTSNNKSDEGKAKDAMASECQFIAGSILRLGRAAGVHMIQATQRPDAKLIPGESKANLAVRINCGRTDSTASSMILDNSEGTRVRGYPRGRLWLQINGVGNHAQGFWADEDWLDEWLASKGLNADGSPVGSGGQSRLAHLANMGDFDGTDLDTQSGVDNASVIERIREEDEWGFDDDEEGESDPAPAYDDGPMGRPELSSVGKGKGDAVRGDGEWDPLMQFVAGENNA